MQNYNFLNFEKVLQLNELAIRKYGGSAGVRDVASLESALSQPMATFGDQYLHEDAIHMAAAYYYHISESQSFHDGNKRTGFLSMYAFLKQNGYDLIIPDDYLWPILMDVATGQLSKEEFTIQIREYCHKLN